MTAQINRRDFLAGSAGLTIAVALGVPAGGAQAQAQGALNAWIAIGTDDSVTIQAPAAEMGQGVMTSLPLLVAEDLDADWRKVKIVQAPADHRRYGNPMLGGFMATNASFSMQGYYEPLRIAGAQARLILLQNAAERWGVPAAELATEPNSVVHAASGRRLSYGEIAGFVKVPAELPKLEAKDLKAPDRFRLIGRDVPRVDVPDKATGRARYGMDVQVPGMIYASVLRAPLHESAPDKVNDAAARKVAGVLDVVPLPYGVGVLANTYEAAAAGKDALEAFWTPARAAGFDSEAMADIYAAHLRDPARQAVVWNAQGDAGAALAGAARKVAAEYRCAHMYHAQMEPMNCTAQVNEAGDSAEIWTGTQAPSALLNTAARALGTTPDKIRLHQMLLGGGFGRRLTADYAVDAVLLSKHAKKPVKVIWSREDDVRAGHLRPMTVHAMEAGFDGAGALVAWRHRLAGEPVDSFYNPARLQAQQGKDIILMRGTEVPFYGIPNKLAEHVAELHGNRLGPWRGIGAGHNKFASESFVDEVALALGLDPLELRLRLLKDAPRARAVVAAAAEMAEWSRRREGTALGLAFSEYHNSVAAGVAELAVDRASGAIRVRRFWAAIDPGRAVQPANIEAQMEGSIVWGLSSALGERITLAKGAVQQSNFHDYRVLRMSEVPEIAVRVISTDNKPTAVGEIGVPIVAPAIANAVARLTGARLRRLPMLPEDVLAALKA